MRTLRQLDSAGGAAFLALLLATACSLRLPLSRNDWEDAGGDGDADGDSDPDSAPPVTCLGGASCDDGNPCTADRCDPGGATADPGTGCSSAPLTDGSSCEGVFFCRASETCSAGLCSFDSGTPTCSDGYECTAEACDEVEDGCGASYPMHEVCADIGGWCDPTDPRADARGCTDGRDCDTDDECRDGSWCNGAETCSPEGACQPGQNPCDDGVACTDDSCFEDFPDGARCPGTPIDSRCLEGDMCTVDSCEPGAPGAGADGCLHMPVECPPDDNPCTADGCDPSTGRCGTVTPGVPCDTGDPCLAEGWCDWRGRCEAAALDCRDGDPCTADSCDSGAGGCVHEPRCISDRRCCAGCAPGTDPDCPPPSDGDGDADADPG